MLIIRPHPLREHVLSCNRPGLASRQTFSTRMCVRLPNSALDHAVSQMSSCAANPVSWPTKPPCLGTKEECTMIVSVLTSVQSLCFVQQNRFT